MNFLLFVFCALFVVFTPSLAAPAPANPGAADNGWVKPVSCCVDRVNFNYCPMLCPQAKKYFGITSEP